MNGVSFLYLSQEDVIESGGLDCDLFIRSIEKIFEVHTNEDYIQPLKPYLKRKDQTHVADRIIAMPSYVGGEFNISGIKWISSAHENPIKYNLPRASGVIVLNDPIKGIPVCILDSTLINIMRTAAVSGVATKLLANKDSEELGIVGAGVIGKMQVKFIKHVLPNLHRVKIYDLDNKRANKWALEVEDEMNIRVAVESSVYDCLKEADIIVTSTTASEGYIDSSAIKKGTLFLNVSLNDPKYSVVMESDKVIVDDWEQCNRKDKLLNRMFKDGIITENDIYAEIGQIVTGKIQGRENKDEKIFFNPMGMSIEDIGCAFEIYQKAKATSVGKILPLWESPITV